MWIQRFIDTARGTFELFEKGQGVPLCVTHLYSAYDNRGNTFANPFTTNYRVYLINLRGCGNSIEAEDESQYSLIESVNDLEAIRLALGIERWGVAGHSTGGMLALQYAIQVPDALTKIIAGGTSASKEYAANPSSIYCRKNPNFDRIMEIMNQLNDSMTPIEIRKEINREWASMSFYSAEKLEKALTIPNSGKTVGDRLNYFMKKEFPTYDLRERLSNVALPTYIYAGKYDAQCPYEYGVEIANLIPHASFTTFEESNHNPFVEEEEEFRDFVKSTIHDDLLPKFNTLIQGAEK
ncbi:MAG TPA: alpha/beta hydrolase [Sporosarcina psychrophila]|uniref:Alpha/beta hydrolase n=1 Tax=Sporosarcina psychrophila TaxID=1476 RepID=A0A921KDQ0_SPOPS|nr:alpha/beta hydrolase [Sporosarcina psychrophila]